MNTIWIRYGWAVVLAHIAITLPHGSAHAGLGVWLSPLASAFVVLAILLAALVAMALFHTGLYVPRRCCLLPRWLAP